MKAFWCWKRSNGSGDQYFEDVIKAAQGGTDGGKGEGGVRLRLVPLRRMGKCLTDSVGVKSLFAQVDLAICPHDLDWSTRSFWILLCKIGRAHV